MTNGHVGYLRPCRQMLAPQPLKAARGILEINAASRYICGVHREVVHGQSSGFPHGKHLTWRAQPTNEAPSDCPAEAVRGRLSCWQISWNCPRAWRNPPSDGGFQCALCAWDTRLHTPRVVRDIFSLRPLRVAFGGVYAWSINTIAPRHRGRKSGSHPCDARITSFVAPGNALAARLLARVASSAKLRHQISALGFFCCPSFVEGSNTANK